MKIYSMGEGVFDEVVKDLDGKPCIVLMCDSREELSNALRGVSFDTPVTVVPVFPPAPGSPSGAHDAG